MKKSIFIIMLFSLVAITGCSSDGLVKKEEMNKDLIEIGQAFVSGKQEGIAETLVGIMKEAEKCEPFEVFIGDARMGLINVACLQQEQSESEAPIEN